MRGIHINEFKKRINKLNSYDKPNYIYIPLINSEDYIIYVKKNDYVYKGSIVAKTKGNFVKTLFSSVSGFVEDICIINNVKYIKIKNDFKEKIEKKIKPTKNINSYSKEELIEILKETGIVGMSGAGFPTYVKYESDLNTLIVNAVECEPYLTNDFILVKEKIEEILLCIDALIEINNLDIAIIAIKKNNKELKNKIETYLGTYDKIKLVEVPNIYPMGWERNVVKCALGVTYDKLPKEKGIVVNNISTIYAIYQALKFHKPILERIITIGGNMVKNPCNMLVKIGTSTEELFSQISFKRNEDIVVYSGGPMMGIASDSIVITPQTTSIMIDAKKDEIELSCLRCSKCVKNCPVYIEPVLIKDALKSKEELEKLHPEKCIECGLCSYICPAKIKLRDKVIEAKKIIRRKV